MVCEQERLWQTIKPKKIHLIVWNQNRAVCRSTLDSTSHATKQLQLDQKVREARAGATKHEAHIFLSSPKKKNGWHTFKPRKALHIFNFPQKKVRHVKYVSKQSIA